MSQLGPLPAGLDRAQLVAAVQAGLRSLPDAAKVVVALSGGPDSTALAYLTVEAREDLEVVLGHVRHGLRDDSDDAAVARKHADYLGVLLEIRQVSVQRSGRGPQASARAARYTALREIATAVGATAILLGHTADDQAETVLLRAARGTGVAGLAAMAPASGDLVRPMLRLRRADVHRFVVLEGLPTATDPGNADVGVPRIAVREIGLPLLHRVGRDPVGALGRLAALAQEDEAALAALARDVVARAAVRVGRVVAIRDEDLARLPRAVTRRVWRHLVQEAAGDLPSAAVVERIEALGRGEQFDLAGQLVASAGGGWRALAPRETPVVAARDLVVPGETSWPEAGAVIHASTATSPSATAAQPTLPGVWMPTVPTPAVADLPGGRPERSVLAVAADVGRLQVRQRRPGDRIRTRVGTQKVADVFVDAGVPRPARDLWPLVVAGDGARVVWVPGLAVDVDAHAAGRRDPEVLLTLAAG